MSKQFGKSGNRALRERWEKRQKKQAGGKGKAHAEKGALKCKIKTNG